MLASEASQLRWLSCLSRSSQSGQPQRACRPPQVLLLLSLIGYSNAQTGIGSLNDPCDCMQHHDFWMMTRAHIRDVFWVENFPHRMFDPNDAVHGWVRSQSCMYSPENEESHRPTALSDCIPGFLLVHIICMQRHLAEGRPERVRDYASELMRLIPFGKNCIDNSGWPITVAHVVQYYRRVRRAFAARPPEGHPWPQHLLKELAWIGSKGDSIGVEVSIEEEDSENGEALDGEPVPLGEEADVCPAHSLPDAHVCWILGPPGATCLDACREAGMAFRQPSEWPADPLVPRILGLTDSVPKEFSVQREWAHFECYVSQEARFHLAEPTHRLPQDWSYPICELACPCAPELSEQFREALHAVPFLD